MTRIRELIGRIFKKKTAPQKTAEPRKAAPAGEPSPEKKQEAPAIVVQRCELTQADFEQWKVRIRRAMSFSCEQMPRQIPQKGSRGGYGFRFPLQGTKNQATLVIECKDETLRTMTVRVAQEGSDRCAMHYILMGTREALLAYLADEANIGTLFESIRTLSDRISRID